MNARSSTAALLALTACGSAASPAEPVASPPPVAVSPSSGSAIEEMFPLVDGHVYQYVTESDAGGGDLMVARVTRSDARRGALQLPSGTKQFEYAGDGVRLTSAAGAGAYVLKEPLVQGTEWRGEHGGVVSIVEVGATVQVPAGTFRGCVKTLERRGGDRPLQVHTVFCPGTGIVLLEAASGVAMERAALMSYGPPMDLGPDGVRRLPIEE